MVHKKNDAPATDSAHDRGIIVRDPRVRTPVFTDEWTKPNGGVLGGARSIWTSVKPRHVVLPDGSTRALYKNPKFRGELRIRKMRMGKDGRNKAVYVAPPKGALIRGRAP